MNINEPLALPKGSVQAILILILTGGVLVATFEKIEVSKDILIVWAAIIGTYFGARGPINNA